MVRWASRAAKSTSSVPGDSPTRFPAGAALRLEISVPSILTLMWASTRRSSLSAAARAWRACPAWFAGATASRVQSVPITPTGWLAKIVGWRLRCTATASRPTTPASTTATAIWPMRRFTGAGAS